jgi:hypothetical protein
MMNCIYIGLIIYVVVGLVLMSDLHVKNVTPDPYVYPVNASIVYTKETLQEIVEVKQKKTIAKIVNNILYAVVYEAHKGMKKYTWENNEAILDNTMYDKIKIKLLEKFPDLMITYYDNYNILIDWNNYDLVNYEG